MRRVPRSLRNLLKMQPNNIIPVRCTENSFYSAWIEFLAPYHKLTAREREVAARLLQQYYKFRENIVNADSPNDPEKQEVLRDLLWSKKSRSDIMASLKMSPAHFQMVIAKLRTAGFLISNDINPNYLPHKRQGESRFVLMVVYDWSTPRNPIRRETEQAGGAGV